MTEPYHRHMQVTLGFDSTPWRSVIQRTIEGAMFVVFLLSCTSSGP